ncbi:MAG: (Fe-S)-binding protein, partial [Planctomycetota bacterium]
MALTGLEIFKLLPKTNCKKCGMPTCLAFAMQLAQKKAKLDACPDVSEEAKQKLDAASAPPMQLVKFGRPDNQLQVGQETVMFRHEEKFYNPSILAATACDTLSPDDLKARIETINALQFERVGTKLGAGAIAVINDSGSADTFANACQAVKDSSTLALIIVSDSADAVAAAVAKTADIVPLIASATPDNAEAMAKIAKDNNCPIVAKAPTLDGLAELTEKIKAQGVEQIALNLDSPSL